MRIRRPAAVPLLECVMSGGVRRAPTARIADLRARSQTLVSQLPAGVRRLTDFDRYPVDLSDALVEAGRAVAARAARR